MAGRPHAIRWNWKLQVPSIPRVGCRKVCCILQCYEQLLATNFDCFDPQDLPRTFAGHPALDQDGLKGLRRLLTAYSRHNPAVGYRQVLSLQSRAKSLICFWSILNSGRNHLVAGLPVSYLVFACSCCSSNSTFCTCLILDSVRRQVFLALAM